MRHAAAVVSLAGLVLMVGVGLVLSRTSTLSLEERIVLYVVGLVLFILGGAGAGGRRISGA